MTNQEIVTLIDRVNADTTLTNTERLSKVLQATESDVPGFSVSPSSDENGPTLDDISREALAVLRAHYIGESADVTEEVLKGGY